MTQHTPNHNDERSTKLNGIVRNFSLLLCLGMLAGVLIWSKLRLATDIPRSAYADPRETELGDDTPLDDQQSSESSSLEPGDTEHAQVLDTDAQGDGVDAVERSDDGE